DPRLRLQVCRLIGGVLSDGYKNIRLRGRIGQRLGVRRTRKRHAESGLVREIRGERRPKRQRESEHESGSGVHDQLARAYFSAFWLPREYGFAAGAGGCRLTS